MSKKICRYISIPLCILLIVSIFSMFNVNADDSKTTYISKSENETIYQFKIHENLINYGTSTFEHGLITMNTSEGVECFCINPLVKLRTERPTKIIELKELIEQNHIDYLCAGFDYIESNYNKNDAKLLKQIFLWDDVLVSRINNNYYTNFSVEITGGTGSIRTQSAYSYLEQIKAYATANAYRYDGKGFVYAADGKNSGSGYYPSVLPNGSQDSLSLSWTKQAGKLKIIKQPAN